jgi:hypothetical protein
MENLKFTIMGRQQSVVQLTGSIGNLTFYKTKDGFLARQRGEGVSKDRMLSDPKFARLLENQSEFGRTTQAGRLIRTALRDILVKRADRFMSRRLSKTISTILHADPVNVRGGRLVQNGDLGLLKRFEFNENGRVFGAVFAPFTTAIDRVAGTLSLDMPAFNPQKMIVHPRGATHFKLKITGSSLDFENNTYLSNVVETPEIGVLALQQDTIQLTSQLPPDLPMPLLLTLCIDYFQMVNGQLYSLENGAFNGIAIVDVDQVVS